MHGARDVAVIIGSLRRESINRKVAMAAFALAPVSLRLRIIEIGDLPLCNQDHDASSPSQSTAFRAAVKPADAVLFVTPEYNRSIPAPLKNALDVGSRPFGESVWNGKPGGMISASPSPIGGFGASQHLRQSLAALNVAVLAQPEVYLGGADQLFDERGVLIDDAARTLLQGFLLAFAAWIEAATRH